jgi:hypothetical protein
MANALYRPPTLDCRARALALWPGLDRTRLRRTGGDPVRIARLVGRRTTLPIEAILGLLTGGAAETPRRASDPDRGPS